MMHLSGKEPLPFSFRVKINIADAVEVGRLFDAAFNKCRDAGSAKFSVKKAKFENDVLTGSFLCSLAYQRSFIIWRHENHSEASALRFFLEFHKYVAASMGTRVQNDRFESNSIQKKIHFVFRGVIAPMNEENLAAVRRRCS